MSEEAARSRLAAAAREWVSASEARAVHLQRVSSRQSRLSWARVYCRRGMGNSPFEPI